MNKRTRKMIADKVRYELQEGTHTFTMCQACGRNGCISERCWECWLDILVAGGITKWILEGSDAVHAVRETGGKDESK